MMCDIFFVVAAALLAPAVPMTFHSLHFSTPATVLVVLCCTRCVAVLARSRQKSIYSSAWRSFIPCMALAELLCNQFLTVFLS